MGVFAFLIKPKMTSRRQLYTSELFVNNHDNSNNSISDWMDMTCVSWSSVGLYEGCCSNLCVPSFVRWPVFQLHSTLWGVMWQICNGFDFSTSFPEYEKESGLLSFSWELFRTEWVSEQITNRCADGVRSLLYDNILDAVTSWWIWCTQWFVFLYY